jgi:3-deoxy-D-manno-octulosonate 8-phosphate phosphatase KdsC-like HAD superfamily phosphatase
LSFALHCTGLTLVRTLRAVSFVAGDVEDDALDGDIGRVVGVGACDVECQIGLVKRVQYVHMTTGGRGRLAAWCDLDNLPSHLDR